MKGKILPQVKVEELEVADPTFEGGSSHTATAVLTNPTAKEWTYSVELYLDVTKIATSGVGTVTVPAGGSASVNFPITAPLAEGTFKVYLDVTVEGELLVHYEGTESVTIAISPAIEVGPITWA